MLKKIIFILAIVCIPYGIRAGWIVRCDSIEVDSIDVLFNDIQRYAIDSTILRKIYPNWQDSIEWCKERIGYTESEIHVMEVDEFPKAMTLSTPDWVYLMQEYNTAHIKIMVYNLQLQIYELRVILQKAGIN